jgi:hypothetical protein
MGTLLPGKIFCYLPEFYFAGQRLNTSFNNCPRALKKISSGQALFISAS